MFNRLGARAVIAPVQSGIVGSFPALNARAAGAARGVDRADPPQLAAFEAETGGRPAPFAVNQIVHASNERSSTLEVASASKCLLSITSLRPPAEVVTAVHRYGGIVLSRRHLDPSRREALEQGVDGLILSAPGRAAMPGPEPPRLVSRSGLL